MGITDRYMLYIEHTPLIGNQSNETGYDIQAKIYPYSEQTLITASTGVYWRANNGSWNFLQMQSLGNDYYHAVIPAQVNGTMVSYYIHAEDTSGREENHPYIGAPDAYCFTAQGDIQQNTPPEQPQLSICSYTKFSTSSASKKFFFLFFYDLVLIDRVQ